jgi:hypothetical protein
LREDTILVNKREFFLAIKLTVCLQSGLHNVSKVLTLGEWKAILEDEIERAETPFEGTCSHPLERNTNTFHSDSGRDANGDTRLEGDAGSPSLGPASLELL